MADQTPRDLHAEIEQHEAETCQLADARDTARTEANQLRGELTRIHTAVTDAEARVLQAFADADVEGVDLNAMTPAELAAFVMTAIKKEASE